MSTFHHFDGTQLWADPTDIEFRVQVTGTLSGGGYSWERCTYQSTASNSLLIPDINPQSDCGGTSPLYEVNNQAITNFPFFAKASVRGIGPLGTPIYDFDAGSISQGGTLDGVTLIDPIIRGAVTLPPGTIVNDSAITIRFPAALTVNNGAPTFYSANTTDTIDSGFTYTINGPGNFAINAPLTLGCSLNFAYETPVVFGVTLNNRQLTCKVVQVFEPTAPNLSITGFAPFDPTKAEFHVIYNASNFSFYLPPQNTGSLLANRFDCPGPVTAVLSPGESCCALYDNINSVWIIWANWPTPTSNGIVLAGTTNNLQLTPDVVQQFDTTAGAFHITGFVPYDVTKWEEHIIQNAGPNLLTIDNLSGGSLAGNRVSCPGGVNAPVLSGNMCRIIYDPGNLGWFLGDNYIPPVAVAASFPLPTTNTFIVPAIGASVNVPVTPSTLLLIGQIVDISNNTGGLMIGQVVSYTGGGTGFNFLLGQLLGAVGVGDTIPIGALVSPGAFAPLPNQAITVVASVAGTATLTQISLGQKFSKVYIYLNGFSGTATITFPVPFTATNLSVVTTGLATSLVALTLTTVTITTVAPTTGLEVIEGF